METVDEMFSTEIMVKQARKFLVILHNSLRKYVLLFIYSKVDLWSWFLSRKYYCIRRHLTIPRRVFDSWSHIGHTKDWGVLWRELAVMFTEGSLIVDPIRASICVTQIDYGSAWDIIASQWFWVNCIHQWLLPPTCNMFTNMLLTFKSW